jgi:hypothetical protein
LKSDRFCDGQLKGVKVSKYRSYQINDIEKFIWLLCDKIHYFRPIDENERTMYELSNLLEAIEECDNTISRLFGKRVGAQTTAVGEKVRTWLSTMKESSKKYSPQFFITKRNLTKIVT